MNLRGVKESGPRVRACPTYGFVALVFAHARRRAGASSRSGDAPVAESAHYGIRADAPRPAACSPSSSCCAPSPPGCTALTGVEAVSNGVPAFQPPKSRNAAATLAIMGGLAITMFAGITALALAAHVHMAENPANLIGLPAGDDAEDRARARSARRLRHRRRLLPAAGFTAAILILAANTAFNGFPVLASLLGRDRFLPRQLAHRGDRLVFSQRDRPARRARRRC